MQFCPTCGTLLQIDPAGGGHRMRFSCPYCPYVCAIQSKIVRRILLKKKEIEPIIKWEVAVATHPKTQATCPDCNNKEAYFKQVQVGSDDEPTTTFYTCCNASCRNQWREN